MAKYARLKDGFLIDVWRVPEDFPTTAVRDQCLGATGWIVVPDSATHGAKDNGNGTYTNPVIPQPDPVPALLSKTAFMDLCQTAFGGNATGRARFAKIIRACATSADDDVIFVYERYQAAQTFDKARVYQFMTLLISKGLTLITPAVSAAERTAINDGWPNV